MKETEDKLLKLYFLLHMSLIPAADWFVKTLMIQSPESAREPCSIWSELYDVDFPFRTPFKGR